MISKQKKIGTDSRHMLVSAVVAAFICLVLCVSSANAQTSGNSSLSGVVSDPTGRGSTGRDRRDSQPRQPIQPVNHHRRRRAIQLHEHSL